MLGLLLVCPTTSFVPVGVRLATPRATLLPSSSLRMHHIEGEIHGLPRTGDKFDAGVSAWGAAFDKFGSDSYNLGTYDRLSMARAYGLGLWDDYSGCVLDAEGYAELGECQRSALTVRKRANPVAALVDAFWARVRQRQKFWETRAFSSARADAEDVLEVQECLINANGPAERAACMA